MKFRNILILFGIGTCISTAVAVYQHLFFTEAETGFFNHSVQKLGWTLSLFIAVVVFCIGLVASQCARYPTRPKKHPVHFIVFSAILSVAFVIEPFFNQFIVSLDIGLKVAVIVFAVLSAAGIFLFSLKNVLNLTKSGICMMLPLAYSLLRLALTFTRYSRLPTVASHAYELAWLCVAVFFCLNMAMLHADVRKVSCLKLLLPLALILTCVGLVSAAPQLVASFISPEQLHGGTVWPLLELAFGAYASSYAIFTYSKINLRSTKRRKAKNSIMEDGDVPDTEFKNTKEN